MSFAIFAVARRARRRRSSVYPHFGDTRQQLLHALTTLNGLRLSGRWTAPRGADFICTDFQAIRPVPDVRNNTLLVTSILSPGLRYNGEMLLAALAGSLFRLFSVALVPGFAVKAWRHTGFSSGAVL
jgi:hypothetical protein